MTTVRQLPEILSVETIAKTRIFEVQAVDLRFSNGEERRFERLTPQRRSSVNGHTDSRSVSYFLSRICGRFRTL